MQSLGFRHLTKLGISEIQLSILIMDHSLPIKWQKLIIINENSFTNITFKIGRPFLSNDLKDKLEFPGKDLKQLQKYVSRDILPSNFGGTAKCVRFLDFPTIKSGEQKLLKLWHPFKSNIE
ncbi:uncharacterized protein B4U80_14780 [Leptotrombidium deliense]|uniref:CRAL-TRIO domain-containing protein n=1 Tax=Leptotrombidium deliense TaxID=299467 RepID=A0A443QFD1_9ACAR|nr:uncharacterized protein B4U80_14780 [Leptotrombidium deliense]